MKPQLAVIRGCVKNSEYNGLIVEVVLNCRPFECWESPSGNRYGHNPMPTTAVKSLGSPFVLDGGDIDEFSRFLSSRVVPINDNPGNETFVTEARNKLKGRKTEITAKGELA
jgi:hypothetical protein